MATNAQLEDEATGSGSQPQSYTHDYRINMQLLPDPETPGAPRDWQVTCGFQCHDLLRVMRQGLFWTTSNIVPEGCFYTTTGDEIRKPYTMKRIWELRELPDKPKYQSRWVGTFNLYVTKSEQLRTIRLDMLSRENVFRCFAKGKDGLHVFNYSPSPSLANVNCWLDNLHPLDGSWWFWPMDSPAGGQHEESTGGGGYAEKLESTEYGLK
ncbi:hypothetical protein B0T26DRAFT_677790 [Lasiosphaeria miniovina]|uniref:Uncharacterized protein n=1 Tax=Lasiosphaeria miniovina TaxID=1954250 RepID=A0AA40ACS6_9PEZI|nr:uncharacterized protein B0T26DRAFT_677790 [Lasiosphaeria miniovina]KAK0713456.1 hypothetical protein B0T26DRAFT_677790 [Lasiosphaeria miniovina]